MCNAHQPALPGAPTRTDDRASRCSSCWWSHHRRHSAGHRRHALIRASRTSSRISGEINGLLGDMQYARSEAIKQGQNVVVCVSTTGTDCTAGDTPLERGLDRVREHAPTPPTTGGNAALVLRAQAAFTDATRHADRWGDQQCLVRSRRARAGSAHHHERQRRRHAAAPRCDQQRHAGPAACRSPMSATSPCSSRRRLPTCT